MKAGLLKLAMLLGLIAATGTGLRDLGLSTPHVRGLFLGALAGGIAALLRLWLSGKSDMRWPVAAALGLALLTTFLRDMGLPLPFTAMDYQEGAFCGLVAGAAAIWVRWPVAESVGANQSGTTST